ncbi:MAG: glycosyltransferase family 2 protein [Candidatus Pacebacteria bacterium]|nr:glycosyltransferase family 2 protein [Candidatus Paceibacterota bacterium]
MKSVKKLAIVVSVYNEEKRALNTVKKILKLDKQAVLVLVDDGSSDNSYKILQDEFGKNKQVVILQHIINLGKGAAMKTGVEKAWQIGCDAVVFLDADGQHDPKHLNEFRKELKNNDLVFGRRALGVEMPIIRRWGNILMVKLVKQFFNIQRSDILCGYFAVKKKIYKEIEWDEPRYGVEAQIAAMTGKKNISFSEVNVDTIYIDKYKGLSIFEAFGFFIKIPYWYIKK